MNECVVGGVKQGEGITDVVKVVLDRQRTERSVGGKWTRSAQVPYEWRYYEKEVFPELSGSPFGLQQDRSGQRSRSGLHAIADAY
jgi:hypothetical protein